MTCVGRSEMLDLEKIRKMSVEGLEKVGKFIFTIAQGPRDRVLKQPLVGLLLLRMDSARFANFCDRLSRWRNSRSSGTRSVTRGLRLLQQLCTRSTGCDCACALSRTPELWLWLELFNDGKRRWLWRSLNVCACFDSCFWPFYATSAASEGVTKIFLPLLLPLRVSRRFLCHFCCHWGCHEPFSATSAATGGVTKNFLPLLLPLRVPRRFFCHFCCYWGCHEEFSATSAATEGVTKIKSMFVAVEAESEKSP